MDTSSQPNSTIMTTHSLTQKPLSEPELLNLKHQPLTSFLNMNIQFKKTELLSKDGEIHYMFNTTNSMESELGPPMDGLNTMES
jgi:hypothetical protein